MYTWNECIIHRIKVYSEQKYTWNTCTDEINVYTRRVYHTRNKCNTHRTNVQYTELTYTLDECIIQGMSVLYTRRVYYTLNKFIIQETNVSYMELNYTLDECIIH